MPHDQNALPHWTTTILKAAAFFNIAWGIWIVFFPSAYFSLLGMDLPRYPVIWQGLGMIVALFGVGYAIAAGNPLRHWLVILIGFFGKAGVPFGLLWAYGTGELPLRFGLILIVNDLIWWIPFLIILYRITRVLQNRNALDSDSDSDIYHILESVCTASGNSVVDLSQSGPVHLIFLRHFGCTFCRETLAEFGSRRQRESALASAHLVFVHMGSPCRGEMMLNRYHLSGMEHISDPHRRLYRAFGFERARLGQLLGPKVILRGIRAILTGGHWAGRLEGDGFQLPGRVLMHRGKVVQVVHYKTAADHPDFTELTKLNPVLADT
ncbi:MAG: hypothetical protein JW763_10920 [candidate division Zixibacteria bacterium]|nr:hypothetical protein [candidate division Zixibacteria bacterium]